MFALAIIQVACSLIALGLLCYVWTLQRRRQRLMAKMAESLHQYHRCIAENLDRLEDSWAKTYERMADGLETLRAYAADEEPRLPQ